MVAKVDADEILAEARYRAGITALFVVIFILLTAAVTAYGYRQRQADLYQDLYHAERERRQAQEEFRTTLYSIGDAVITTDTEGRVTRMNPVAERLTGWTEAEARGKPLEEVFRIVNEETRAEVENPVQRVLREGMVVGLANHTLLIARDGTERPIADSGAPIRDENGADHRRGAGLPRPDRGACGTERPAGERRTISFLVREHAERLCLLQDAL